MISRQLAEALLAARSWGAWWAVPELSYCWKADIIAFKSPGQVLEIELKSSWADYQHDMLKHQLISHPSRKWSCKYYKLDIAKYVFLLGDYPSRWRPTHFVYAAAPELAQRIVDDPDRPRPFGVWSLRENLAYKNLAPMRRLCHLQPEQMGRFRADLFRRAMWWMQGQLDDQARSETR